MAWPVGLAGGALLAIAGGWEPIMRGLADPGRAGLVAVNYPAFTLDTVRALAVGLAAAALCFQLMRGKLRADQWAPLMALLVLLDLWSVERRFIQFRPPAAQSYAADDVVRVLNADTLLYRLVPASGQGEGLSDNYWMVHRIRSTNGYQGVELHRYDELLGGKNDWRNVLSGNPAVWRLLAIRYLLVDQPISVSDFIPAASNPVRDYRGRDVFLYRYARAEPYAFLVPEAVKVPDERALPTVTDPRFDPRRILVVPPDAPVGLSQLSALPEAIPTPVQITELRAGAYRFLLSEPLAKAAYLFVAENYYPAWRAQVDGKDVRVLRAQYALMAVPLPAGARAVELEFWSRRYQQGKLVTLVAWSLVLLLAGYGWRNRG